MCMPKMYGFLKRDWIDFFTKTVGSLVFLKWVSKDQKSLTKCVSLLWCITYIVQQDARCHGRTHYRRNIILASGNQKYPMSQTTWSTSSHMAYFTMSWETLTMCWETWCSFDLNTIKFNGLYKHRCEVVKLWFSKTWWSMPCVMR